MPISLYGRPSLKKKRPLYSGDILESFHRPPLVILIDFFAWNNIRAGCGRRTTNR